MSEPFLSPVGRVINHSVWQPRTKDRDGRPLDHPRYELWLAIRKDDPKWPDFWNNLYAIGAAEWPRGEYQWPKFSWKVKDGDGINDQGKPYPEVCKGHWMVSYSSTFAPQVFNAQNKEITEGHQAFKAGDFVEVYGNAKSNDSSQTPGLYMNLNMIRVVGFGEAIVSGPSAEDAFGAAPTQLPPGASATPVAGAPLAAPGPGAPQSPPAPQGGAPGYPTPPAPGGTPPMAAPAPQVTPPPLSPGTQPAYGQPTGNTGPGVPTNAYPSSPPPLPPAAAPSAAPQAAPAATSYPTDVQPNHGFVQGPGQPPQ